MAQVFKLAANVLNSIDNAAKETLEATEDHESAAVIRSKLRKGTVGLSTTAGKGGGSSGNLAAVDSHSSHVSADGSSGEHSTGVMPVAAQEEIERLNAECLDLERQCEELKEELKRAWDEYKAAQEKAAAREADLVEEMDMIQTAKQEERQQMVAQFTKTSEELEIANKRFELLLEENKLIARKCKDMEDSSQQWRSREEALQTELAEAKACASSNVGIIREELRLSEQALDTMRRDHATWMHQSHQRQAQLEQSNQELGASLADAQRTIERLKAGSRSDKDEALTLELQELRRQLETATSAAESAEDRCQEMRRLAATRDSEVRASKLLWDDEKKRLNESMNKYAAEIEELKKNLSTAQQHTAVGTDGIFRNIRTDAEDQVKSLSQQLLKKQSMVQDLLAERSALKVRVHDLETRCKSAEERYNDLLSAEFEDGIAEDALESGAISSRGSRQLMQRRGKGGVAGRKSGLPKSEMSSDLEKTYGVKPLPALARAVDTLDSWTQLTGRYLRVYPQLRLAFVFYLILLHIWALAILAFHTHSLDDGVPNSSSPIFPSPN